MADKQIYHVKFHQGAWMWVFTFGMLVILAGFLAFFSFNLDKRFNPPEPGSYVLDFRAEGVPVKIDYENSWYVVATIARADGNEIRFYDPNTGKLTGTYWQPASAQAESGAE